MKSNTHLRIIFSNNDFNIITYDIDIHVVKRIVKKNFNDYN